MHRKKAGPNDHAIFTRTAKKTRRINLQGTTLRGGTRL